MTYDGMESIRFVVVTMTSKRAVAKLHTSLSSVSSLCCRETSSHIEQLDTRMGCIFSFLSALVFDNVDDAKAVSKKIDKQILQELKNEPDEIEILILGAQESGKSTLLKQVSIVCFFPPENL